MQLCPMLRAEAAKDNEYCELRSTMLSFPQSTLQKGFYGCSKEGREVTVETKRKHRLQ